MEKTMKQWAKYYFVQLAVDHGDTLRGYINELPASHQEAVKAEIDRMIKLTTTRRGFEWT
jgi:hypothetical protein